MKVALITDTHFGARGDSILFYDYMMEFYNNVFFPELEKRNIDTVIHLGDVVDRRKFINFNILTRMKKEFLGRLQDMNITTHMLVGNHDTYFKNTNSVNAMKELIDASHPNAPIIYEEVENIKLPDGTDVLMLPWINSENYKSSLTAVKKSKSKVCFGHLELAGFEMMRGLKCEDGMDMKYFEKFDLTCSGHFHTKSNQGNLHYLGTAYELFWSDFNDKKGFHIWDTETNELEHIINPYKMFNKIWYDDNTKVTEDFSHLKDKYVKIIVKEKSNAFHFEQLIDQMYQVGVGDLAIVEDEIDIDWEDTTDEDHAEDTIALLSKYIDNYELEVDKTKLKVIMQELYSDALRGE